MKIESWDAARAALQEQISELNTQISHYPGPITGCDAQFNHMLEQRSRLNAELTRLEESIAANPGAEALISFKKSCPYLAG